MFENIIAKEGKQKILYAFFAFIFFVIVEFSFLALISFAFFLWFIFIYRYKNVNINSLDKNCIYSPISGKIVAIDGKKLYIKVSLFDSHILRALDNSKADILIKRGVNLLLSSIKSKKLNENALIEFDNCSMLLVSSLFNDSINIEKKDIYKKGEKIGTFLDGEVIVEISENYKINVEIGQKVDSGVTILALNK